LTNPRKLSIEILCLFGDLLAVPVGDRYPPGPSDAHRKRELIFAALLEELELLSRERPVLMIFEDIHWADPTLPSTSRQSHRTGTTTADPDGDHFSARIFAAMD
jgi:hypothetical protein